MIWKDQNHHHHYLRSDQSALLKLLNQYIFYHVSLGAAESIFCLWCGVWSLVCSMLVSTVSWSSSSSYSALKGTELCNPAPEPLAEFVVASKSPAVLNSPPPWPALPRTSHQKCTLSRSRTQTLQCVERLIALSIRDITKGATYGSSWGWAACQLLTSCCCVTGEKRIRQ